MLYSRDRICCLGDVSNRDKSGTRRSADYSSFQAIPLSAEQFVVERCRFGSVRRLKLSPQSFSGEQLEMCDTIAKQPSFRRVVHVFEIGLIKLVLVVAVPKAGKDAEPSGIINVDYQQIANHNRSDEMRSLG
ncbi:hypothetical protein CIHG_06147 [Coccidioides immitis H538.4]|uniref:Uncharacterized protein n=1 Tax=Coccidioides immitis H538.4 TaxID=396776 RepID=A0A0J8RT07_COCIT|nr:hypothetical protein CIHG_06147 [Coccidioides immitis H538.4]